MAFPRHPRPRPPAPAAVALAAILALLGGGCAAPRAASPPHPIPIKVVVVTLFEIGEDTGDKPGEFQYWVEREHLSHSLAVPGTHRPVRYGDDGVLAICTGGGIAGLDHAACSINILHT